MRTAFFLFVMAVAMPFVHNVSAQSLEDNENYRDFRKWVTANHGDPNPLEVVYKWCIESYDKMIASGVSPSTRVPDDEHRPFWKGTVQEIKEKNCDLKKLTGDLEAKHAPYKANLKADKLRLVIDWKTGTVYRYALAGGKYTSDPKLLAAARVWFLDIGRATNDTRICVNGGKLSKVRRYSFDANHKLLGTTEKEYCGNPPPSAYR